MPSATEITNCDVLIVGGGPAGATAAILLAQQGREVTLVDKAEHPRFHIGESLLPATVTLLDTLGVRRQVEQIGMLKYGAEFVSPDHEHTSTVEFADAWDKSMPYAWQVRRSAFDEILFRRAQAVGANCLEGCRISDVQFDNDGANVIGQMLSGEQKCWRARYVVDASGRDTLLASKFGAKSRNEKHNSAALFGHYVGAKRLPGRLEGHISIFWFQHGWFWFIPLADGTTSIGAVCWPYYLKSRSKPLPEFFADTIGMCPKLLRRLAAAQLIDNKVYATGNYCYASNHASGRHYLLLGDAYAFVDPVFSSGVHFAMQSAFASIAVIDASLSAAPTLAKLRDGYEKRMKMGPEEFSWFIFRMTNPSLRNLFMYPGNPFRAKEALLSLLAGDIYGNTPIWRALAWLKIIYYADSFWHWRRSLSAWRARRRNIVDQGPVSGENVIAKA